VIIDPGYMTEKFPDFQIDSVDAAEKELRQFRADGGQAMIDAMPTGGRNAAKLAEVSRRTGIHLVSSTGLHLQKYYPPDHWGHHLDEESLAKVFTAEIETGLQPEDSSQPRLSSRAGVIKIAGGLDRLNDYEHRLFVAAAHTHRQTGCPILTHTEQGTAAMVQVDLLRQQGVDLTHVCLSHTDRKPDLTYHRDLLQTGVKVEFDSAFRWPKNQGNPTLDLVLTLTPEFPTQILLGLDAARRSYWKSYGGQPGLSFLLTDSRPELIARGLEPALLDNIFIHNPATTFQFKPVSNL
jgi:phosphotriesterase-related protein